MTRGSRTRLAVLGAIAVEPASGSTVRRSIQHSIGHFWSESYGQIYPTLGELERDGLIEAVSSHARSKVFAVTPAGRIHLSELLHAEFSQQPPRDETLLRIFFGHFLGVDASVTLLRTSLEASHALLARLQERRSLLESDYRDDPNLPYWLLTVRSGELTAAARITWAREAIATLSAPAEEARS